MSNSKKRIDFVITWVDDGDPLWNEERIKYTNKTKTGGDQRKKRYRNWDNLKYWFRSIEKYAPWVNKVYFVTYGHYPKWLNLDNKKLVLVKHEDYIPEKYLPTFSNRAIELNLHKISGLTEQFVYFNDDMFLTNTVKPTDFFRDGKPCETAILNVYCLGQQDRLNHEYTSIENVRATPIYDMLPINRNFEKHKSILKNFHKWYSFHYIGKAYRTLLLSPWKSFPGFVINHLPYSYLKSTFEEVWRKEEELLDLSCSHKFRVSTDVNQWVMNYWQMASGNFSPRNPQIGHYYGITDIDKARKCADSIKGQKYKIICINDEVIRETEFDAIKKVINGGFENLFPQKSSFEI